jgi:type IV pilus assembly protein PilA
MFNLRKNRKGFTIIELIVVIAIIAILAAIAIPTFVGLTEKANNAVATADARSLATAANAWNALNPNEDQVDTTAEITAANLVGLYPEGITDATLALTYLNFQNGVWVVVEPTAPAEG